MSLKIDTQSEQVRSSQHGSIFTLLHLARFQQFLSLSTLLRVALIIALLTGALLTSLVSSVQPAEAARIQSTLKTADAVNSSTTSPTSITPRDTAATGPVSHLDQTATKTPSILAGRAATPGAHAQAHAAVPNVSGSQPFDGLGDLPFYNYVSRALTDSLQMKVNVANGNLLLHASEASIHGTGIDLGLDNYYNSEGTSLLDNGNAWYMGIGRGISIDVSNPDSGVTLHGSSGYSAFFPSDGNHEFKDAPGLNATLYHFQNGSNNYQLTFHQSGLKWLFNGTYGNLFAIHDKNNNSISFSYNGSGYLSSITDTQGRQITVTLNADNQIASITDPANRTIKYSYDNTAPQGIWLTSITDANNEKTTFTYNGSYQISKITDPLNQATSFTYNTSGQVATITDATGINPITFGYHASSDSACSGIVPSPGAALPCTVVTDQNGHSTTYSYNSQLQVTYTKDALGHVTSKTFDALNYNVTQYSDALLDTSVFQFSQDGKNNLTSSADGNGATTTFGYNTSGNTPYYPLSQTDPQKNKTDYTYDGNGNLATATDDKSGKGLTYTYNGNGTVATQKDGNGNSTSYGYDSKGNLTTITPPAPQGGTTLTYNNVSQVTSLTDGKNQKTTYTYDNYGRPLTVTYADNSTLTYVYDADGNAKSETDRRGTTTFAYDVLNRLTLKTLPGKSTLGTTYDAVGNLMSIQGYSFYIYDQANRVTSVKDNDGAQTTYGYDNANHKTRIQYPNGTGMLLTYDKAGHELTNIGGLMNASGQITTQYTNYQYSYQSNGSSVALVQNVTYLDPVTHANTTQSYTYDTQSRLTQALVTPYGSSTQLNKYNYAYDTNGNLTQKQIAASSTQVNYSFNADNELTSSISGGTNTTYSYDGNGNLTGNSTGLSITYNAQDQATAINGNVYGYSGADQNQRVQNNTQTSVYSGLGLILDSTASGTTQYTRCSCGMLVDERLQNGQKFYYLFDGLESVVGMTDSSGNEVNSYDYDPYGNITSSHEQSGINNPWKYASGYFDSSTGLTKFGIRYYDPTTGRWTQRTPIAGSLQETLKANPYEYADDNPVNEVDPNGKAGISSVQLWDCIGSALVAAGASFTFDLGVDAALEIGSGALLTPVVIAALAVEFVVGVGFLMVAIAEKCPFLIS